jgi:hypothetical protein
MTRKSRPTFSETLLRALFGIDVPTRGEHEADAARATAKMRWLAARSRRLERLALEADVVARPEPEDWAPSPKARS